MPAIVSSLLLIGTIHIFCRRKHNSLLSKTNHCLALNQRACWFLVFFSFLWTVRHCQRWYSAVRLRSFISLLYLQINDAVFSIKLGAASVYCDKFLTNVRQCGTMLECIRTVHTQYTHSLVQLLNTELKRETSWSTVGLYTFKTLYKPTPCQNFTFHLGGFCCPKIAINQLIDMKAGYRMRHL